MHAPMKALGQVSRVFQALRIAVNDEVNELESVLGGAATLVRPGGRLAVITYHSIEDARVRRLLDPLEAKGRGSAWRPLTKEPVCPSTEEVTRNPRARSARLRVGERL